MLYPKIGIRPCIDGRWGGVRESLEEQTMGMARSAAELISKNVKYPDGTPVQCVISETTIGGGAEAARCADQFSKENVVATLSVTPCWCYGSETFDMDPNTIKAVWGFNGTERPGAVYLAAVMAAFAQKGLPAFSIYGKDVQDIDDKTIPEDVAEKIIRFAKQFMRIICEVYGCERVYMCTMCDGPNNHYHIQLIPRYAHEKRGSRNFVKERKTYRFDKERYEAVRERIAQYACNANGSENNC